MPSRPLTASVATLAVADPASRDRAALFELAAEALPVRGWLDAAAAAHLPEPAEAVLPGGSPFRSGRPGRSRAGWCVS